MKQQSSCCSFGKDTLTVLRLYALYSSLFPHYKVVLRVSFNFLGFNHVFVCYFILLSCFIFIVENTVIQFSFPSEPLCDHEISL